MSYKRASILVNIILYTYDMKVCYILLCDSCYATQMMAVTHLSLQNVVDEGHWLLACTSAEVVILTQLLYKCCDKYCLTAILDCFVSFQMSSSCQDQWQGSTYSLHCLHYSCYCSKNSTIRLVAYILPCTVKSQLPLVICSRKSAACKR